MLLFIGLFGISSLIELLLVIKPFWKYRKYIICIDIPLLTVGSVGLLCARFQIAIIIVVLLSLYRGFNLTKILAQRMQADYLFRSASRTILWLIALQQVILWVDIINRSMGDPDKFWFFVLCAWLASASLTFFITSNRSLKRTRYVASDRHLSDRDLPSITVAIPARNETDDLRLCLETIIGSDYPKIEIIVLDDNSQNRHTPEIIRSFAQDGVRFIKGTTPPASWLAKNHAYQQLAEAASGEYILFCGVDTRFSTSTIRLMLECILNKNKRMLSFMPVNVVPHFNEFQSLLIQPTRYAWELALPRRAVKQPPVLSTAWLIARNFLLASGSFEGINHNITPERYLARKAVEADDGYSFVQAGPIGLSSNKSATEQQATAVRVRYPQLKRRPENIALQTIVELSVLCGIIGVLIYGVQSEIAWMIELGIICTVLFIVGYIRIVRLCYGQFIWRSVLILPIVCLFDVYILQKSMCKYEFSEVTWKDRNIAVPMMHR